LVINVESSFAVNIAIETQKVTATSDSNGIWQAVSTNSVGCSWYILALS